MNKDGLASLYIEGAAVLYAADDKEESENALKIAGFLGKDIKFKDLGIYVKSVIESHPDLGSYANSVAFRMEKSANEIRDKYGTGMEKMECDPESVSRRIKKKYPG